MKTYLLETDFLIDLFKQRPEASEIIQKLSNIGDIVISVLSISELRSGWDMREATLYLPQLYAIAQTIPVTQVVAEKAGELRYNYSKRGQMLPTVDTLIAATCILNDYSLVTRNVRHYPMPEIELFNKKNIE